MLAVSFFVLIFSTALWLFFSIMKVVEVLGGASIMTLGLGEILSYILFVFGPIFIVWFVFGIISQFLHNSRFNRNLNRLFAQMKKNQDYSDLIARIMLENEQQLRDGFIVQQFDLFISDMNELISEIIQRSSLASVEQIEHLWSKVRNGGKWAFGKVIIEVNQNQPTFQIRIYEKAHKDMVLAGTIMEFCARYQSIVELFEKHDNERIFLNIIETGVLGKVFSILAPIADDLKRKREAAQSYALHEPVYDKQVYEPQNIETISSEPAAQPAMSTETNDILVSEEDEVFERRDSQKPSLFSRLSKINKKLPPLFHKKEVEEEEYIDYRARVDSKDEFSIALKKSFGENAEDKNTLAPSAETAPSFLKEEPSFDLTSMGEEEEKQFTIEPSSGQEADAIPVFNNTQRTLESLRKEWENMSLKSKMPTPEEKVAVQNLNMTQKTPSAKAEENGDEISSPFQGWVDEEKYK